MSNLEDVQLTKENVIEFGAWLGSLAAKALIEVGAVTFSIDAEGCVLMKVPEGRVARIEQGGPA